jgi:hypothetical protein
VRLLLDRGADVHARTDIQATSLQHNPSPNSSPNPNPNPNSNPNPP